MDAVPRDTLSSPPTPDVPSADSLAPPDPGLPGVAEQHAWWPTAQLMLVQGRVTARVVEESFVLRWQLEGAVGRITGGAQGSLVGSLTPGQWIDERFEAQAWHPEALSRPVVAATDPLEQPQTIPRVAPDASLEATLGLGHGPAIGIEAKVVTRWIQRPGRGWLLSFAATGSATTPENAPTPESAPGGMSTAGSPSSHLGGSGVASLVAWTTVDSDQLPEPGAELVFDLFLSLRWTTADSRRQVPEVVEPPAASGAKHGLTDAARGEAEPALVVGYGAETNSVEQHQGQGLMVARGSMSDLAGRSVGHYVGAMRPGTPGADGAPPPSPFQVTFDIGGRGSVTLVGLGAQRAIPILDGGATLLMVTGQGVITGGEGRFAGVRGVGTIQGATLLPQGVEPEPGSHLPFKTFYQLRFAEAAPHTPHPGGSESANTVVLTGSSLSDASHSAPAMSAMPPTTPPSPPVSPGAPSDSAGWTASPSPSSTPPSAMPAMPATPAMTAPGIPPGANPETYKLGTVDGLFDRIADFLLLSDREPAEPVFEGGHPVGLRFRHRLQRFAVEDQPTTTDRVTASNRVSRQAMADLELELRWIPDDYAARPGVVPPATPFDPTRGQRFVVLRGGVTFLDAQRCRVSVFGTGQTFPKTLDQPNPLVFGMALLVVDATGTLQGLPGMVSVNGVLDAEGRSSLAVLVRLADPAGQLLLPQIPALPDPMPASDPAWTFLTLLGNNDQRDPTQLIVTPQGTMEGAWLRQQQHPIATGFELYAPQGLATAAVTGPITTRLQAQLHLDPTLPPPVPFTSQDARFTFFDTTQQPVGAFSANIVEARGFPTQLPGAPNPIQRGAALAPIVGGSGLFAGVRGLVTVINWISIFPRQVSGFFLIRLYDPEGRFRATHQQTDCTRCESRPPSPLWGDP